MKIGKNINFQFFKNSRNDSIIPWDIEEYLQVVKNQTGLSEKQLLKDLEIIFKKIRERRRYRETEDYKGKSLKEKMNWNQFYESLNTKTKNFLDSCIRVGYDDPNKVKKLLNLDDVGYHELKINFYKEIKEYFSVIEAKDEKIVSGILSLYKNFKKDQTLKRKKEKFDEPK